MTYTIYQLPLTNKNKFRDYNKETFDINNYVGVWEDETEDSFTEKEILRRCEEIYERFNWVRPSHYCGHSMSVSDLIVFENGTYYCNGLGFEKIK